MTSARLQAAHGDPGTIDTDVREEDGTVTVTENVVRPDDAAEIGAVASDRVARPRLDGPKPSRLVTWTAILGGLLGFLMFVLTPFMPVTLSQTSLSWPQRGSMNSVDAPLVAYAPTQLEMDVPISLADQFPDRSGVLVGTMPLDAEKATANGLQVRTGENGLSVVSKDSVLLSLDREQLDANRDGRSSSAPTRRRPSSRSRAPSTRRASPSRGPSSPTPARRSPAFTRICPQRLTRRPPRLPASTSRCRSTPATRRSRPR